MRMQHSDHSHTAGHRSDGGSNPLSRNADYPFWGELIVLLWLIIMGINAEKWDRQVDIYPTHCRLFCRTAVQSKARYCAGFFTPRTSCQRLQQFGNATSREKQKRHQVHRR